MHETKKAQPRTGFKFFTIDALAKLNGLYPSLSEVTQTSTGCWQTHVGYV